MMIDQGGRPPAISPPGRDRVAALLAITGALSLAGVMFLPWYRADDAGSAESAWQAYTYVLPLLLALVLIGALLGAAAAAGRSVRFGTAAAVIAFGFLVTIIVVVQLFIDRPGSNAGTAVAFGGYLGLAAINTVKGAAILMVVSARSRRRRAASLQPG
jgi:hypothetical protein